MDCLPWLRNIVDVLEIRKHKLYDSDSGCGLQLHTLSSPGERNGRFSQNCKFGRNGKSEQNGKFSKNGMSGQKGQVPMIVGVWLMAVVLWQEYDY